MKTKILFFILLILSFQRAFSQCNPLFSTVTNGNVISLSNNSTPFFVAGSIIDYSIDFGDGSPLLTNSYPGMTHNHQYAANGIYSVSMMQVITDSITNIISCTASYNSNVSITNTINCTMNPTVSYIPNANNVNAIDFTTYPNITGVPPGFVYGISVIYDYGDGTSGNSPTHIYTATATYNVIATVTVHDPGMPAIVYCSQSTTVSVPFVYSNPCNGLPTFTLGTVANNVYSISNISLVSPQNGYLIDYLIDYGDGTTFNTNYPMNYYSHLYTNVGIYNVCITRTITDSLTNVVICSNSSCNTANVITNIPPYSGCDANYTVSPDTMGVALNYYFDASVSTTANGTITSYAWDFGDGSSGTGIAASHTYAATGVYNVCLTINTSGACTDATCFNVSVQSINPASLYWLSGEIFQSYNANLIPVNAAMVYLIQFDAITQSLHLIQSAYTAGGSAYGFQVNPGDYLVKAAPLPNNLLITSYLVPTYNVNQVLWSNANTTTVTNASANNVDITLQQGLNIGGPGFISGAVLAGANKTSAIGDPKEGLTVLLIQSATNKVYTYTSTDIYGNYSFQNIPTGAYKIYIEELGKTMSPFAIDITAVSNQFIDMNFESNSTENHPLQILSSIATEKVNSDLFIYPNPANDQINLRLGNAENSDVRIEIVSVEGKIIYAYHIEKVTKEISIDIKSLTKGYYFLKLISADNTSLVKFNKL